MRVFKRNGQEQDFDLGKITAALTKAYNATGIGTKDSIEAVLGTVQQSLSGVSTITVEDIQDIVEKALVANNQYDIAKAYIIYRHDKKLNKKFTDMEEQILSVVDGTNDTQRSENANKHLDVNCTVRDYIAGVACKSLAEKILPKRVIEAHKKKWIHFHDMDYSPVMHLTNCDLLNVEDMLQNGFQMGDVHIDKPRKFSTACNLAAQINMQVSSSQYGGQTISWAHLLPFVEGTRESADGFIKETVDNLPLFIRILIKPIVGLFRKRLIETITRLDIYTGIKTYQYQTLSGYTANGQTPFVTNVLNLREAETEEELKDLAIIFEEIFKRRLKGVKDKSNKFVGPLFPKLLYFTCDGLNIDKKDPYYYLTKLAAKCIALRMQPDIMSEKKTREVKSGQVIACMGSVAPNEIVTYRIGNSVYVEAIESMWQRLGEIYREAKQAEGTIDCYMKSDGIKIYDNKQKDFVDCLCITKNWADQFLQVKIGDRILVTTLDHKFETENRGEVFGYNLKSGDQIIVSKEMPSVDNIVRETEIQTVTEVKTLTKSGWSYDVTTSSEHFEVSGIYSHNCRSFLAPVWEDVRYPISAKFHWQKIEDGNIQYNGAPNKNFDYSRGFGKYSELPKDPVGKVVINFAGNSGWVKEIDSERDELIITRPKVYGRLNCGVVTINLPHAALTAKKRAEEEHTDIKETFYKVLDERLDICHEALLERWKSVQKIKAKNSPILWMHGGITRLPPEASVADYIKSRQNISQTSISLGYIGLCETCWAIIGESNTTEAGRQFSKDVLNYMNKVLADWKSQDVLGYAIYGTPEESVTLSAAQALQRDFGYVEHITDKDFVVNSYHVDPREHIDAFTKLTIEGEYLALSSGGAVSYVETADLTDNPEAIETLIKHMHNSIMYAEVNRKIGVCYNCGYQGDIPLTKSTDGDFIFTCPECGNNDSTKMHVEARICGYIGEISNNNVNKGRLDDIYNRVLHLT